jgi:hypothetical protein
VLASATGAGPNSAANRCRYESVRVVGIAGGVTLPKLNGLKPRHTFRGDEEPAAKIGLSMLRLGLARIADWAGSPLDFVAKGLAHHCKANKIEQVSKVFEAANIQLQDEMMELTDYQRCQQEREEPSSRMFLLVDYEQSAMVQIGPTLRMLENVDPHLPSAFFQVFATNLGRWMRVYDFRDAEMYASDQMEMLDEEELKESFYPKVKASRPACLKKVPTYAKALRFLSDIQARLSGSNRKLVRLCLQMHEEGKRHELAHPSMLRDVLPELGDYFDQTDYPGPGALLVIEEDDLTEACFTEEMQYLGQDSPIGSTAMLLIDLTQRSQNILDGQVKRVFDYAGAMLRSLAHAAELILEIRGIYDEDLRQRRLEPRV